MIKFLKSFWTAQKTIWLFLGDKKKDYVLYNIIIFLVFFYDLVPALVFGKVVDFFTEYEKGDNLAPFYFLSIFLAVSWTLASMIRLTCKNKLGNIAIIAKSNARVTSINTLLNLSADYHSTKNSGNSLQQIFAGSQALHDIVKLLYKNVWSILSSFLGIIIIFMFLSPPFLLFMLVYSTLFFFIEFYFNNKISELSIKENINLEKSSGSVIETTNNILAVKSLGFEKEIHGHLKTKEEYIKEIQLKKSNIKNYKWKVFQTLNGVGLGFFVWLIGDSIISGMVTVGSILVFSSYYSRLRDLTQSTTDTTTEFIEYSASLNRLKEIAESDKTTVRDGQSFPESWETLAFNSVDFTYNSNDKGIYGLDLEIKKGEIIGVVGSSGGGKSTMAKLLIDLYQPTRGQIKVDGIPYNAISHTSILNSISTVPQEAELFNLSVADNITLMREVDEGYLQTILKVTELGDVVKKLPSGLNTLIGEKGYSLSGGERQRVGIARALYKDSQIVVFDEATSMLDGKTEKKIIKNVLNEFRNKKTFVFIAHRLAALDSADRIIVFKDGRLVEQGTYAFLKENKGAFVEIFESQIKDQKVIKSAENDN